MILLEKNFRAAILCTHTLKKKKKKAQDMVTV